VIITRSGVLALLLARLLVRAWLADQVRSTYAAARVFDHAAAVAGWLR
jgi:hypothetical protein